MIFPYQYDTNLLILDYNYISNLLSITLLERRAYHILFCVHIQLQTSKGWLGLNESSTIIHLYG